MIIMKKIYLTLIAFLLASMNMLAQGWPANYSGVMLQGFSWGFLRLLPMDCFREASR